MWIVEFYHPYFGWLDYDLQFESSQAANEWITKNKSPYKRRATQLTSR